MVLTDRQRADLHAGIYEYLRHQQGDAFQDAADAFARADPIAATDGAAGTKSNGGIITPLLEKKWTAIPRLQKKVLELERQATHNAKIHAHRTNLGLSNGPSGNPADGGGGRRMLPRLPASNTLRGHSMGVTCVCVHPVYTMVVSGSEDGTIKIWDHESGEYIRTLKGHTNTVHDVSFTPSGTHLASCSADLSIKLWDFTSQYNCLRTLRGHDHTISAIRFLPLINVESLRASPEQSSSGAGTGITSVVAQSKQLLSASRDQTVKVWDVETGFCDATLTEHSDWVRCLAVQAAEPSSSDTSESPRWASAGNDQVIRVYEQDNTKSLPLATLRGHEHVIEALAFICEQTSGGKLGMKSTSNADTNPRDYLASGGRDRTVRLWNLMDESCMAVFSSHENWVRAVLIHPSGQYIVSAADDKSIRVFDIKAQRCLRSLENAHDHFVTAIDMHSTLPILVSGSVDQTVKCWQLD
uniref:Lissencephaly-1 homolog n=1 Tax=Entomoneis paludosa TaxID=265537 RepID=A0A7S2Y8Q0_9STRA|mmetsp:Transcript_22417/g.46732  ORF Transcript_22417/g.46732 Transcript_22417/m.46732 type:complete len:469 (+) Transcript_22417:235-1641(+)|eukprot:CAMPEP_0172463906 /NCGR_PEP_ID=MMETSP1065-20121228/48819_1 /TAXON_ID=265537 /ORGANISM="Amphiprora paludosa, Strain CCMP125" /LENGTH=468 /DNA_ID=CAMNT_0013219985 /DNA_START=436 /DNA_END=1842 /DNA_ORIENTATION=-